MRQFSLLIALLVTVIVASATAQSSSPQAIPMNRAQRAPEAPPLSPPEIVPIQQAEDVGPFAVQGKITFLRVHEVGSGWGPGGDSLDVEVVVHLNSDLSKGYGFRLRDDGNRPVRQGMLDLLRDAFSNNWTVILDYTKVDDTRNNGTIIRVALIK